MLNVRVTLVGVQHPSKTVSKSGRKVASTLRKLRKVVRLERLLYARLVQDLLSFKLALLHDHASPLGQIQHVHIDVSSWCVGHWDLIHVPLLNDTLLGLLVRCSIIGHGIVGTALHLW